MAFNGQTIEKGFSRLGAFIGDAWDGKSILEGNKSIIGTIGDSLLSPVRFAGNLSRKKDISDSIANTYLKNSRRHRLQVDGKWIKDGKEVASKAEADLVHDWSLGNIQYGNIAGTASALGIGYSAAHGLITDSNGNTDIAGIPFI